MPGSKRNSCSRMTGSPLLRFIFTSPVWKRLFSTETEAYTRAKVVMQRQTVSRTIATMPPVSFFAVLVSAIFFLLLTPAGK